MINPYVWLALSQETRAKLADALGLKKSAAVTVVNNKVECDGYTPSDLMGITLTKLQGYTGSKDTDFLRVWFLAVEKAEGKLEIKENVGQTKEINEEKTSVKRTSPARYTPPKRGRPKKGGR